jgi:hypothetical protein
VTATIAGAIMLVLPTNVSYADKARGLARFGREAPQRIQASMETRGASPFEGSGRAADWPGSIRRLFEVESERPHPALAGYIAAELRGPDLILLPFLKALATVDRALVHVGLLHSTGLTISARKRRA